MLEELVTMDQENRQLKLSAKAVSSRLLRGKIANISSGKQINMLLKTFIFTAKSLELL